MSKKERVNYIILAVIIIVVMLLTIAGSNLYRNYENNKGNVSYISKYVSTISCNELSNAITELKSNTYLYLSYTGNKNIYEFEKKIRRVLKQNDLEESFIFVNCTDDLGDNNQVNSLKNVLSVGNSDLILPAIVYFKDNEPVDYIDSKEGLIDIGSFSQMLDKYEIEANK